MCATYSMKIKMKIINRIENGGVFHGKKFEITKYILLVQL